MLGIFNEFGKLHHTFSGNNNLFAICQVTINGFITIETGDQASIEKGVIEALDTLGPDGYILSPVDNVRDPSDQVWENVLVFINTWKKYYNI